MQCFIEDIQQESKKKMRAVQDSRDMLNGKRKIAMISAISCG